MRKAKEPDGRVRYLTADERQALIDGANDRLRIYIVAALQTGARRAELMRLRWADVDMTTGVVTFRRTKNGRDRSVPMTDALRALFQSLPRPIAASAPVLPVYDDPHVLTRSFARLVERAGLKDVTFHDLRHDVASTLTMASANQRTVMEVLGHRDPRMTVRYQHLEPGRLRAAMGALNNARADTLSSEGAGRMRAITIAIIIVVGLPLGVALGRYGTVQPCEMLALETAWLGARSYDTGRGPFQALGARLALADRSPGECIVALGRALTQDPVDVSLDCMVAELGPDSKQWSKSPGHEAVSRKCMSLQWFLWRQSPK